MAITHAQRQQTCRLPIADGTVDDVGDRYAITGIIQSLEATGAILELFQESWAIDPTWNAFLIPQSNDGQLSIGLQGFSTAFVGLFTGVPGEVDLGTPITNAQATDGVGYYEICQRTGFKMLPLWHPDSKLIKDGYGDYVRAKSADERHPLDNLRSRGNDRQSGPQNSEATDEFIAVSIAPEDL